MSLVGESSAGWVRQLADAPRRQRKDERLVGTGGQRVADHVCHRGRGAHDARFPRPFHAERVVGDGVLDDDWENPEWIDFAIRCFFDRAA